MFRRAAAKHTGLVVAVTVLASCSSGGGPPAAPGGPGPAPTAPAPFDLSFPRSGHSERLDFPNAGSFGYRCRKHGSSGMAGGVMVSAGGLDSVVVSVGSGGNVFSPASVTIKPGGYVRWVNASSRSDHTVTST